MNFAALSRRVRYSIILVTILVLGLLAAWAVLNTSIPERAIFLVPILVLVFIGLSWDRIYLQDRTI